MIELLLYLLVLMSKVKGNINAGIRQEHLLRGLEVPFYLWFTTLDGGVFLRKCLTSLDLSVELQFLL